MDFTRPADDNLFDRAREYGAQSIWICVSLLIGASMLRLIPANRRAEEQKILAQITRLRVQSLLAG